MVQRHTEQLADVAPMVPSLAVPVSQMVDQLVAMIKHVDSVVPEQIIAVPKISWTSRFSSHCSPRAAVEVPTVVFPFLQQPDAQIVDIPVLGARGTPGYGGLQGFHPRQGSQRTVEQIVDIPVPGGGPHADPGSAAPTAVSRDELVKGFLRTFPVGQRCGCRRESACEGARALELVDPGGF